MKLVDLLVKELEEWPEGVTFFVQDCDGEVKAGMGSELSGPTDTGVWIRHITLDNYNFYSCLCTDWRTSIVTKDIYTKHKEGMLLTQQTQMKLDFRNTKIRIESEEHNKVFQEAVFAAGGKWMHSGEFYRKGVNFIFLNDSLGMTLCDNAVFFQEHDYKEIQFPLPTKGHVHAELMAQYAEDAKTTDEPWELWQIKDKYKDDVWICCLRHPIWATHLEYRRKPKTHIVNGVEVPDLRVLPKYGDSYWCPDPTSKQYVQIFDNLGTMHDLHREESWLCYEYTEEGKQAAILHSKIMLGIITS